MELSADDIKLIRLIPTLGNHILITYAEMWARYQGILGSGTLRLG